MLPQKRFAGGSQSFPSTWAVYISEVCGIHWSPNWILKLSVNLLNMIQKLNTRIPWGYWYYWWLFRILMNIEYYKNLFDSSEFIPWKISIWISGMSRRIENRLRPWCNVVQCLDFMWFLGKLDDTWLVSKEWDHWALMLKSWGITEEFHQEVRLHSSFVTIVI